MMVMLVCITSLISQYVWIEFNYTWLKQQLMNELIR